MKDYTIPLSPVPQRFNIFLAGREHQLTVRWNAAPEGGWWIDISRPDDGEPVLSGIPIVTGADMLSPFRDLGFGGSLVCYSGTSDEAPTYENLGAGNQLLFVVGDDG